MVIYNRSFTSFRDTMVWVLFIGLDLQDDKFPANAERPHPSPSESESVQVGLYQRLPCRTGNGNGLQATSLDYVSFVYAFQEILDIIIAGYATASADIYERYFSKCAATFVEISLIESSVFISQNFHRIVFPYKFRSLTFKLPTDC